ncbi:MAG: RsmE family RNA methyltransferase [Candidatus Kapaibacterium sp.]
MECFIVLPSDVDLERRELTLRGDEAHHAIRSLRLHAGDALMATNLIGTCYRSRVEHAAAGSLVCSIEEILPNFSEPARDVLLIPGMISQPARWEFLLEKSTELGVKAIQPVLTERTERVHFRRDRSEKILRAAVKQTKRAWMPAIKSTLSGGETSSFKLASLREALASASMEGRSIFLLHEAAAETASLVRAMIWESSKAMAIAVGPEGGFSEEEVRMAHEEFGARVVSLGPRRLRAETAAIAALAIIMASE